MFIKESFNGGGAARVICRLMNRLCREHQVYFVFFGVNAAPYYIDPAVCVIHVKSRNYEKAEKNSNRETGKKVICSDFPVGES